DLREPVQLGGRVAARPRELGEPLTRIDGGRRGRRMPLDVALERLCRARGIAALGPQLRRAPRRLAAHGRVAVGLGDALELARGARGVARLEIRDREIR